MISNIQWIKEIRFERMFYECLQLLKELDFVAYDFPEIYVLRLHFVCECLRYVSVVDETCRLCM